MRKNRRYSIFLGSILLVLAVAYTINIDGWLLQDDEGTDFYEAWQLQQGHRPGIDFVAEQQPLFILSGSFIIHLAGRSPVALRLFSAATVLLSGLILALAVRRIWGWPAAILALGLTLTSGMVYEQARLFRPDPLMLAWETIGLGLALLAAHTDKRRYWALSGLAYGIAVLFKPFGVFPVAGLAVYFLAEMGRSWRSKRPWRAVVTSGLSFALPFLFAGVGLSLLLYGILGFYYWQPLSYHLEGTASLALSRQLSIVWRNYAYLFLVNLIFIFIPPLWLLNRPRGWSRHAVPRLLLWQLITPLVFLAVSRRIYLRYYIFLVPVFATLLAWHVHLALDKIQQQRPQLARLAPLWILFFILFAAFATQPRLGWLLTRQESGTLALSNYIVAHTAADDVVLTDYAGLNFLAGRQSVPEASIIAGHQILVGAVNTQLLLQRIEEMSVSMVVLQVGGEPRPGHLLILDEYNRFRAYLHAHFELVTEFDRSGQVFEIYQRP